MFEKLGVVHVPVTLTWYGAWRQADSQSSLSV